MKPFVAWSEVLKIHNQPELKKGDYIDAHKLYEVRGIIGRGGFGVVYLIYSLQTGTHYAYKILSPNLANDPSLAERFRKEANIWIDLGWHPNLVRAIGVTEQQGRFFICMEYIKPTEDGLNSLDGYFRKGSIQFAQCLKWAIQFCDGMEYAYSKGIQCHRDIKPANIMIDNLNVKISDFGIARIMDEKKNFEIFNYENGSADVHHAQTAIGTAFGTPFYMSPEQFVDSTKCDQRSDVYSFGVVLYQMRANGSLPFVPPQNIRQHEFWRTIFKLHCECPPPKLDSRIGFIINRCLAKHPDDRYQTFQELRLDLEQMLEKETGEGLQKPQPIEEELNLKGRNLQALGRHIEAIEYFDKELQSKPNEPAAWYNKGKSYHALGKPDKAVPCFYRSAENDFYLSWALEANAKVLTEMKRYEEAIACYDKIISRDRSKKYSASDSLKFSWLFNRGYLLHILSRFQEAVDNYESALNLDLKYIKLEDILFCWLNKGYAEAKLGLCENAVASFKKFLSLVEPNFAEKYSKHILEAKRQIQTN